MDARSRPPRPGGTRHSGQYFLRSRAIADELIDLAGVRSSDHVLEIGGGAGRLTEALLSRGTQLTVVELDPRLADWLRSSFAGHDSVRIVGGDVLNIRLPRTPYRAFGSIPFGRTTPILRRFLDDPSSPLFRVDVLVQHEVARKRAQTWPGTLISLGWLPWWQLSHARRISRAAFEPTPAVDAGLLSASRRDPPLLAPADRVEFVDLLQSGFRRGELPVARSLRVGSHRGDGTHFSATGASQGTPGLPSWTSSIGSTSSDAPVSPGPASVCAGAGPDPDVGPWGLLDSPRPGATAERMRGLLGRSGLAPDEALLLPDCRSVHTVGMRFAIRVAFLDAGPACARRARRATRPAARSAPAGRVGPRAPGRGRRPARRPIRHDPRPGAPGRPPIYSGGCSRRHEIP